MKNAGALVLDAILMAILVLILFGWAIGQHVKIGWFRYIVRDRTRAGEHELAADRALRQLFGVPEPGEPWD